MKSTNFRVVMLGVSLFLAPALLAQTPASANQSAASPAPSAAAAEVPRLIKFSGTLLDALDRPLAGPVGVTFAFHAQQTGGAALWMETQNVTPDAHGFYTVFLGANSTHGVPAELFASGEARWLEVQVERQAEQPRVLLVSVPYALKAADADTLGGKPLSAFVTTSQAAGGSSSASGKRSTSAGVALPAVSGSGNTNVVAKWVDNIGGLGNSQMTDDGTNVNMTGNAGALAYKFTGNAALPSDPTATILNAAGVGPVFSGLSFKVRTGLSAPGDALSIDFNRNVSMTGNASALTYKFTGNAALPTDATATILNAANIGPVFSGFSFKVRTGSPPADALSVDPGQNVILSGNLNLSGAGKAIIFPNGTVMSSAATGVGGGTITGVTAGTGLSGGGTTGGVTLSIPNLGITNPLLAANSVGDFNIADGSLSPAKITGTAATLGANSFTGNQSIAGTVRLSNTFGAEYQPSGLQASGIFWVDASGGILAHLHRFGAGDKNLYVTNDGPSDLTGVFLAVGATSWTSTSDERLKTDVVPVTGILDKIKKIRVVAFDMASMSVDRSTGKATLNRNVPPRRMKNGTVIRQQIGSIAQDWVADFPQLVVEPQAADQYYGLNYERIGVVALGGVKELTALVEAKDAEIKTLSARLAALEQALRQLTQQSEPVR